MNITIIGAGHVGLVTGACFADLGNRVICVDNDINKIQGLKKGKMPIFEPGLEEMTQRNARTGRLKFTNSIAKGTRESEVIFIAVGTPSKSDGEADLSSVENVTRQIAKYTNSYKIVVEKSTVPVQTGEWLKHTLTIYNRKKTKIDVASNPEFLREGSAIWDFLHPDRVVLGVESKRAKKILLELYKPLNAKIVITDIKSAELIKHACNCFLAMKISFINSISNICDKVGGDVKQVADGMGFDKRITRSFLDAGAGWGGACFPKDLAAFIHISEKLGYDFQLLKAVGTVNWQQKINVVKKVQSALWILKGKKIGVLGLSFKPNTDDMREAPSIDIIKMLKEEGAQIKVYDPQAMKEARRILKGIRFCKGPYEVAKESDCLLVLTEWDEFKELDLKKIKKLLRQPLIIDGRNIYDPKEIKKLGFKYIGIGRS